MVGKKHIRVGRLMVLGLLLWLIATLVFRLIGQYLLSPEHPFVVVTVFVAAFPLMYALMNWLLQTQRLEGPERVLGTTAILAPGLLLDGLVSIPFFATVFPNMSSGVAYLFGALMCTAYSSGLLFSFLPGWYVPSSAHVKGSSYKA